MLPVTKPADDTVVLADAPPTSRRPGSVFVADRLWHAAIEADAGGVFSPTLSTVWMDFASGRLRVWSETSNLPRIYLVARSKGEPRTETSALPASEAEIVTRVFCGDQQKVVATEMGLAASTVSGRVLRALSRLNISIRGVPLPLVVAAQAAAGVVRMPLARSALFEHQGLVFLVLSVPKPRLDGVDRLTPAEQDIAALLIEGRSRCEIASRRRASPHTVARQLHSIFAALGVAGRFGLIRRAIELGCFE
jgi:DNA-binding NarL/FixJ family response regulator